MAPSSDPFDNDDLFDDPETLRQVAEVEERHIAATQATSVTQATTRKKTGYHHSIAKPMSGPRAGSNRVPMSKAPPPLNTEPRTRNCGFGQEEGGKFDARRVAAARSRPPPIEEDAPMEIVVNANGQYEFPTPAEDDPIIDARTRPEIRQLVENASLRPGDSRQPLPGSQARREAIAHAVSTSTPVLGMRAPMARSTSSTSTGAIPTAPTLGANRTLSRSISAGNHGLSRSTATSSRLPLGGLPAIPSQGNPSSSQGAASRRAVFELEDERRLRQEREAEVQKLRARLAALESSRDRGPWHDEVQNGDGDSVSVLKQQLWAAQGQAATAVRNKEAVEAKLLAEIEKLRTTTRDLETQMRTRDQEAKHRIETMKTQAVFSNHHALASASKARQQSQWTASQRVASTPHRVGGSPLRDKAYQTPAPLPRSAKGKGRIPPPPKFESLNNAFHTAPGLSARAKRRKTEALSPVASPKGKAQPSSPFSSPSRRLGPQPATPEGSDGGDMEIDWQPGFEDGPMEPVPAAAPDNRAELHHHLLNHVALSPLQCYFGGADQPSILRIVKQKVWYDPDVPEDVGHLLGDQLPPVVPSWRLLCTDLVKACGDSTGTFEELAAEVMRVLAGMVDVMGVLPFLPMGAEIGDIPSTVAEIPATLITVLRLIASTLLLFPSLLDCNSNAAASLVNRLKWISSHVGAARNGGTPVYPFVTLWLDEEKRRTAENGIGHNTRRFVDSELPSNRWQLELADAVIEVSEAVCLSYGKSVWNSDELSTILMDFTAVLPDRPSAGYKHPHIVTRAFDLLAMASCRQDLFRAIIFPTSNLITEDGDASFVDRAARFLVKDHAKFTTEQRHASALSILSALSMLSVSDPDAILLLTEKSVLIPALLILLHREVARIWGVRAADPVKYNPLSIIGPLILLLHHLVYPPPSTRASPSLPEQGKRAEDAEPDSELFAGPQPQAVDLARRLQEASSTKEFDGVQHIFVSTLSVMAYADVDVDDGAWAYASQPPGPDAGTTKEPKRVNWTDDLRTIQFLAQDLLEAVVEGPEGDSVYELYDEKPAPSEGDDYPHDMDVPPVDGEYDEEERMMDDGEWMQEIDDPDE